MAWLDGTKAFYIAQALGVAAIILGFVNYIVKTRVQVLFINSLITATFVVHYLLCGAWTGMAVNAVAFIRNIFYFYSGKNGKVSRVLSFAFTLIMGAMGLAVSLIAREGWYFILSVVALMINSYAMSFSNPNNIRKSILITSPMVLVYNCFVLSVSGAVYEGVAIVSAIIGLIRHKKSD